MTGPAATTSAIPQARLREALHVLEAEGRISAAQAAALIAELGLETAGPGGPARRRPTGPVRERLGEAAAYAGSVLVAASGAVVVAQRWQALGTAGRAGLLGGLTVVLAVVGGLVARTLPRGRVLPTREEHAVRRRLAASTLTAAVATAAGTAAVLATDVRLLAAAAVAVVALVPVQWKVPGALTESAGLAALGLLTGAVLDLTGSGSTAAVLAFALLGAGWALLDGTSVLTTPSLGLALGLGVTLYAGAMGASTDTQPTEGAGLAVLGLLAAGGLAGYARNPRWPLAASGAPAVAVLVLRFASDRLGIAVALLLSGLVLLAVGAVLSGVRRRRGG